MLSGGEIKDTGFDSLLGQLNFVRHWLHNMIFKFLERKQIIIWYLFFLNISVFSFIIWLEQNLLLPGEYRYF